MRKNRRHINYIKLSGSAKIHVNIFIRNVPEISYHTRGSGAETCQGNALGLIEERWGVFGAPDFFLLTDRSLLLLHPMRTTAALQGQTLTTGEESADRDTGHFKFSTCERLKHDSPPP